MAKENIKDRLEIDKLGSLPVAVESFFSIPKILIK